MTQNTAALQDWAKKIYQHAQVNYETGGWDYIVECRTIDDLVDEIKECETYEEALAEVASGASLLGERRDEVRAEIF